MIDRPGQQRATDGAERGRQADSPAEMPMLSWQEILVRTWNESSKDNVALVAAGVTFYAFLALVPMLAAIVLSYGLFARPEAVIHAVGSLTAILPPNVSKLIGGMLLTVVHSSGGKKGLGIFVALAVALWGSRNAAGSLIIALNIAYEEEEQRGFVHRTLLALAITLGAVALGLAAIAATTALAFFANLWPDASGLVRSLGRVVTYPLLASGGAAAAATLYRYGPSRDRARWSWLTPGSLFSALGWLLLTIGFGLYVRRIAHYDATYGSLGAVIALLTWIYLSSYVFLFGGELNSEVEHQTARDTTDGGVQPLGERGAWAADHVANGPDDEDNEKGRGGGESPLANTQMPEDRDKSRMTEPPAEHPYLASRITNRGAQLAGFAKVGMVASVLSTAGLSLLRRKGRAVTGAALIAAAAGLAYLTREKDDKD